MKFTKRLTSIILAMTLSIVTLFAFDSLTVQADDASVSIRTVNIQGGNVIVSTSGKFSSEDNKYHLIASDAHQVAPDGADVAQSGAFSGATFVVPLNKDTENTMLYKKFTVCVMAGGVLTPVSNSMFITNPEAASKVWAKRMDYGKKGILPALEKHIADLNQPATLGAKQVNINIPLSKINSLAGFDYSIAKYNSMGMQVNVIILADKAAGKTYVSPYASGSHHYYGLNATSSASLKALADAASLLAKRYNGASGFGQVDNFIIGNEVNAWYDWNYMKLPSNDAYIMEYYKAFRVMYNAIKSENATANVYTCIDHQWSRAEASYFISGQEFLWKFNSIVASEGNVDWKVAAHPYSAPLTDPCAWTTSALVTHDISSPYITMANIEVLTDFLGTPEMLNPKGAVRNVKLSEVGYTSSMGEQYQAASLVFAYMVAENNRYIDGLIISRETDHTSETVKGLAYGLCNAKGQPKMGFTFYQNAADPSYVAQASAIAGVDLQSLIVAR